MVKYETIISFPEPWTREDCPGIENGRSGDTDLDRKSALSHYGLLYKKIVDLRLFLVRPFWLFDRPFLKISDIESQKWTVIIPRHLSQTAHFHFWQFALMSYRSFLNRSVKNQVPGPSTSNNLPTSRTVHFDLTLGQFISELENVMTYQLLH